jgi:hypothetical protein
VLLLLLAARRAKPGSRLFQIFAIPNSINAAALSSAAE